MDEWQYIPLTSWAVAVTQSPYFDSQKQKVALKSPKLLYFDRTKETTSSEKGHAQSQACPSCQSQAKVKDLYDINSMKILASRTIITNK